MRWIPNNPPREFRVGKDGATRLSDCGRIAAAPDEQVTFLTEAGNEYDVVRKSWGYYATPSLNGRLKEHHLRAALIRNAAKRYYVVLVEEGREGEFERYLADEESALVSWLDETAALECIERGAKGG